VNTNSSEETNLAQLLTDMIKTPQSTKVFNHPALQSNEGGSLGSLNRDIDSATKGIDNVFGSHTNDAYQSAVKGMSTALDSTKSAIRDFFNPSTVDALNASAGIPDSGTIAIPELSTEASSAAIASAAETAATSMPLIVQEGYTAGAAATASATASATAGAIASASEVAEAASAAEAAAAIDSTSWLSLFAF
jgi:hypothetical protein